MIIEVGENLPKKLKDLLNNQQEFLQMEFQKLENISQDIDQCNSTTIATSAANMKHNRYRNMGGFVIILKLVSLCLLFHLQYHMMKMLSC